MIDPLNDILWVARLQRGVRDKMVEKQGGVLCRRHGHNLVVEKMSSGWI